jgi:hypothetical protein
LVIPLVFVFDLNPDTQLLVTIIALEIATISVMLIVFIPKIMAIVEGDEVDDNLQIKRVNKYESKDSANENKELAELKFAGNIDDMKLSKDKKFAVAKEQVAQWTELLMKLEIDSNGSDAKRSSSAGSSHLVHPETIPTAAVTEVQPYRSDADL